MSISKDELIKKQDELQKSFDTMRDRIKSMDIEIGNLKANLNATAGALQMVNQLLADIDSKVESKEPMPAEKNGGVKFSDKLMEEKKLTQEEINTLSPRARAEYMKSIEHEIDDDMDPLDEDEDILEEEEE